MVTRKKILVRVVIIAGITFGLIFLQVILSYNAVKATKNEYEIIGRLQSSPGWNNPQVNRLKKDIFWNEQLLMLSKSDTFYLTVDLRDSLVQLKLKGVYMAEAIIIHHHPGGFLNPVNENIYMHYAAVSPVLNEAANFAKKPVKKVVAYSSENNNEESKNDATAHQPLRWEFTAGDNLRIIITGVKTAPDSSLIFRPKQDLLRYRLQDVFRNPVPGKYTPTLYLWLIDKDAKSIYRAIPSGGKMLFRN